MNSLRLAQTYVLNGDSKAAISMFQQLIEIAPHGLFAADATMALAQYAMDDGDYKQAEKQ